MKYKRDPCRRNVSFGMIAEFKAIGWVIWIVKIAVGIFGGFLFALSFLSGIAFLTGHQVYYETSGSMSPVIREGGLLLVKREETYHPGNIVVFRLEEDGQALCVTHRIVRCVRDNEYRTSGQMTGGQMTSGQMASGHKKDGYRTSEWLITKGDANQTADPEPVPREAVIGRVEGVIPYYGYFCHLIQRRRWVFLGLLMFLLIYSYCLL